MSLWGVLAARATRLDLIWKTRIGVGSKIASAVPVRRLLKSCNQETKGAQVKAFSSVSKGNSRVGAAGIGWTDRGEGNGTGGFWT